MGPCLSTLACALQTLARARSCPSPIQARRELLHLAPLLETIFLPQKRWIHGFSAVDPGGSWWIRCFFGGSCPWAVRVHPTKTEVLSILGVPPVRHHACYIILIPGGPPKTSCKSRPRRPRNLCAPHQNFKGGAGDEDGQPIRILKARGTRTRTTGRLSPSGT